MAQDNILLSRIRIPFDPLDGFMNKDASIAYIQEDNGSEIGSFDLIKGKLIEQSNAGRFFKKALILSRKLLVVGLLTDYIIFDVMLKHLYSTKSMMLDYSGEKLYVINATTHDISVFDAKTLKKLQSKGTGGKTFLMSQGLNKESPVLIIGENRISLLDSQENSIILKLNNAKLKGLDNDNGILFYEIDNIMYTYNMFKQRQLFTIENQNIIAVYNN